MLAKLFYTISFLFLPLFGLDIGSATTNILPLCKIYKDYSNKESISSIKSKKFIQIESKELIFGYAPKFSVWVKCDFSNSSGKSVKKVLEYANPLTQSVTIYENDKIEFSTNLLKSRKNSHLTPAIAIELKPSEKKSVYIHSYSKITTLIVNLKLHTYSNYIKQETMHQVIIALFFGALILIIIYNLTLAIANRKKEYLFYALGFLGVGLHHLIYTGFGKVYLWSNSFNELLLNFAILIMALAVVFLSLFTLEVLSSNSDGKIRKYLTWYIYSLIPLSYVLYFIFGNNFRSIPSVLLLIFMLVYTVYSAFKNKKQAKTLAIGWGFIVSLAIFMLLSSSGVYDIFTMFPYYLEFSVFIEALIFSLVLAKRLKKLEQENIKTKDILIQNHKRTSEQLKKLIDDKTELTDSSYRTLKHKLDNFLQSIMSSKNSIENLVKINALVAYFMAGNKLYSPNSISTIEYFDSLIDEISDIFLKPKLDIKKEIDKDINLSKKELDACGDIVTEALTNIYKYAYPNSSSGKVEIKLFKKSNFYNLYIKDRGMGFKDKKNSNGGLNIIKNIVKHKLKGNIGIITNSGVEIKIVWREGIVDE